MKFLKKNLIYLVLLVVVGVVAFIPNVRKTLQDLFLPVAEIENVVTVPEEDFNVDLKGINVPSTNLKALKSDKLIFLNFWGTWCPPCREEWPAIEALYKGKKDKVEFVLIAMQDKEEAVLKFIKENNYTAPVYIAQSPISGKILPKVFPTTFLLDNSGRILMKETSSKDWNAKSVHDFIDTIKK